MQLVATLACAAALLATAAATAPASEFNHNSTCNTGEPKVRVFNRCPYEVRLWSVQKGLDCPPEDGVPLKPGDFYQENYRKDVKTGVSIKISKALRCQDADSTQLEYFINEGKEYGGNYLDVSYVDCRGGDCPSRQEGFYLKSGNQNGKYLANAANEICPIFSCSSASECAKVAYINPPDPQTKYCSSEADLDFYMCGGEAPGDEPSQAAPSSSEQNEYTPAPAPTSTKAQEAHQQAQAAAVTSPAVAEPKQPKIKTEVVYVTQYEYVNAKRHTHGHRHRNFRA